MSECVHCGYCCRVRPCRFGEWDEKAKACAHLTAENLCGIYDVVVVQPGAEWEPAFGAGCCSPLNSDRRRILDARGTPVCRAE